MKDKREQQKITATEECNVNGGMTSDIQCDKYKKGRLTSFPQCIDYGGPCITPNLSIKTRNTLNNISKTKNSILNNSEDFEKDFE